MERLNVMRTYGQAFGLHGGALLLRQWLLYLPPGYNSQLYVLPTQCIYVFCVDLRTNRLFPNTA